MSAINLTETRQQIAICYDQATISAGKSHSKKAEGNEYASKVYKVRAAALKAYAQTLKDRLKKAERKTFKKVNAE